MFVTGIVLAAGASHRLGRPKQLLPFRGTTLLQSTVDTAGACGFAQLLVILGGSAEPIRASVDLAGADVVANASFGSGCGSSISSAIRRLDPRAEGVVLLLGDQPGIEVAAVRGLIATASGAGIGVCRYRDGLGHPFWFGPDLFADLAVLHGDKAVWKLLHSGRFDVAEHPIDATVPLDVDTWEDYDALLARDRTAAPR